MSAESLLKKLIRGDILVADGATGTNLQIMGLPVGAAAERWVLENPNAVFKLNQAFIDAGAEILLTCTFGGTRIRLRASDLEDNFKAINLKAIEISHSAVDGRDILVAGSIGPTGHMLAPLGDITPEEAEADFEAQARLMCEGGVDLIVIETQFDLNEAQAAVGGVRKITTDLPVVCSFSFDRGTRTMMGVTPKDVALAMNDLKVDILGINCGRSPDDNLAALKQLREETTKPIWFKPNAGMPETDENGKPTYSLQPEAMGALVPLWLAAGAQIIGGCCGTSPEHLAAVAKAVHA